MIIQSIALLDQMDKDINTFAMRVNATVEALRESLCATFCRDVAVVQRAGALAVSLPIAGRDGDHLTAYVTPTTGGWRVSDKGATLMRLSYENDIAKLLTGAREVCWATAPTPRRPPGSRARRTTTGG